MKTHTLHQIVLIDPDKRELFKMNVASENLGRYMLACMVDSDLNFTTKVELRKVVINGTEKPTIIVLATLENDSNEYTVITENS
jgi:hypothetical protein